MDYSKIRLDNERNQHVTKRLNRLNTWQFFKVLYRENIMRLFGFSILMLIFMAPVFAVIVWGNIQNSSFLQNMPALNGFGFSTGMWEGLNEYYTAAAAHNNLVTGLLAVAASIFCSLIFSGGFAVIRDAFWTGKLSAVGVFKSIGKGIKASIPYAIVSTIIIAFAVFGAYEFYMFAVTVMPLWLAIVLLVLICIVIMFIAMYLMILCSVANTYKQSVYENLDDAWRLMWLNILPNIIHFVLALIPVGLYFAMSSSALFTILLVLLLMFGGMYFPLVWNTHMMKTFALFHPVEVKKKKSQHLKAEMPASQQAAPAKAGKGKKGAADVAKPKETEAAAEDTFDDEDIYATDDGIEDIAEATEIADETAVNAEPDKKDEE